MRLERDPSADGPLIKGFSRGGFRVDDSVYRALLITPLSAFEWAPPALDALDEGALAAMLALDPAPEFLLLGTGAVLNRPPRALVASLEARGVGVEAMDSRAAARAWGVLRQEARWIAGALYPL
ncbi:MAG: Mth938-like domain-containing protein [Sphingomonas sp.]